MPNNSLPAQRRNDILNYLKKNQFIRNSVLCDILNVSEATIRRDLEVMEKEGLIERTHGGAIVSHHLHLEPAFDSSSEFHFREKDAIGANAANQIQTGDTVFINFGTTNTQVARHLKSRTDLEDVTIVTNNISVLQELQNSPAYKIILLGGNYRSHSHSLVGMLTMKSLEGIFACKAIIGVDGISLKYGCTTPVETDAEISQKMIENTNGQIFIVADSSKWGVVSNFKVTSLKKISALITDYNFSKDSIKVLQNIPIDVLISTPTVI
jgi:DeoR family fructose operon transcriptional repressor